MHGDAVSVTDAGRVGHGGPRRGAGASSLGGAVLGGQELAGVEIAHHLLGDLRQDALGQRFSGSVLELPERHELHDVPDGGLP